MTAMLLFLGALVSQPADQDAVPLHTPLDRVTTAARIFVDCMVDNARGAAGGRAAPRIAVAIGQRQCRLEARALDDVYRWRHASQGIGQRGVPRAEIRRLVDEAVARVTAERGGR